MKIYPAVDIKDGKCVRLRKGVAEDKTVYYENPLDAAKAFADAGAEYIHVVDLDGAFCGGSKNLGVVSKIADLGMFIELGGGIRDSDTVKAVFDAGVKRAILGTKACTNPDFAITLARKYGDGIAVGIDAKGSRVAVRGWVEVSATKATDLAAALAREGVKTFIYTDIDTDGMLKGANLDAQEEMLKVIEPFGAKLIASGGVASLADIENLADLSIKYPNLDGAVVGKALYEGKVDLRSIVELANGRRA